jgi:hypothetical protein
MKGSVYYRYIDSLDCEVSDGTPAPWRQPVDVYREGGSSKITLSNKILSKKSSNIDNFMKNPRFNQKSLFSDKPDPSVHRHRMKRHVWGTRQMRALHMKDSRDIVKMTTEEEYKKAHAELNKKKAIIARIKNNRLKEVEAIQCEYSEAQMELRRKKEVAAEARDIQEIARGYTIDVMEALVNILKNPDSADTAKIAAGTVLLDRAYGKAPATNLNVNANMDANIKDLDSRDLDKRIAETLARVENITERASEEVKSEKRPADLRKYN